MKPRALPLRIGRLPGAVVVLLVVAGLINQFVIRPRFAELRSLEAQRNELLRREVASGQRDRQLELLARWLGVADLRDPDALEQSVDPVTYIGSLLKRTQLNRVELSTQAARADTVLQSIQSTVRVTGDYARLLQFVRAVELGPPLATVDAVTIEPLLDDQQLLEGRFTISLYSAPGGRP